MRNARDLGLTLVDWLIVLAAGLLVTAIVLPRRHVADVLAAEDQVLEEIRDLGQRIEEHKAAAATDADGDGIGEFPPLPAVFGNRAVQFRQIERTPAFERDGYYYAMFLPGPRQLPVPAGSREVRVDDAEVGYALVAWPVEPGETGMRAYLRTRADGILRHTVDGFPYGGPDACPLPRVPLVVSAATGMRPARLAGEFWTHPR